MKNRKYTLSSVFPNEEVQSIVLDIIDRNNKEMACENLGISYEDINNITWDTIISENTQRTEQIQKRPMMKILGPRGKRSHL